MSSGATFPFNSLSCSQTPVQWPRDRKIDDIPEYKSSEIRILGTTPGPGRVLERANRDGQLVEENPQITLLYERQIFNITDTILHIPGQHRLPGDDKPPAGELHVYFRNSKPARRLQAVRDDVCVVIPLRVGSGRGAQYFEFLNRDAGLRTQFLPALTTILTDKTPALIYKGKDLKNRGAGLPNPDTQCLPESYAIQYILLTTPSFIRAKDIERLRSANRVVGMEAPSDPIGIADLRRFCAYYKSPGLRVGSSTEAPAELPAGVAKMESLKCRAIDPKKDIRGDKIIVDPKARRLHLPTELARGPEFEDAAERGEAGTAIGGTTAAGSVQPGDMEDYLAWPLGIIIGYYAAGFCVSFIQKITQNR